MKKLSDLVAELIDVDHVFCVSGGACMHLLHSFAPRHVPMQTEQGAGFAADAYARIKGLGCALVTSGPGATNLISAIAASYYDSVPVIYITGQVSSFRRARLYGVRQYGFQETPIADMLRYHCAKGVFEVNPQTVKATVQEAIHLATSGRKGPVVLDIADDYQRADVEDQLKAPDYVPPKKDSDCYEIKPGFLFELHSAKKPLLLLGNGARHAREEAIELSRVLNIPIVTTWGVADVFPEGSGPEGSGGIGSFGTHANRGPNFAVQNADYIISVGARLDTKATGYPPAGFAPKARIVMVDIDVKEIGKMESVGRVLHQWYCADAKEFLGTALRWAKQCIECGTRYPDYYDWNKRVRKWLADFPACSEPQYKAIERIDMAKTVVADTGLSLAWLMQKYRWRGERMIHAWNQTPMGYGLPAAIGAAFATGEKVTLIAGDGGFSVNICELATVRRNALPIDIHVFNNQGHGMCRQTQRQWLNGEYLGTSVQGGLPDLYFTPIADAYGVPISEHIIDPEADLKPLVKFGSPNEDATPFLDREVLRAQMA